MNEETQIERARRGDQEAFLALLARHDQRIMSIVYRFTANLYDREDLYQEIFLHCFKSIRAFKAQSQFGTWLTRLALNRCITYMKKQSPPSLPPESDPVPPPDFARREQLRAVRRALARLEGRQQIAFHLYYIEEWSPDRIAEVLACSTGAVKSHLDRARKKIKLDREVRPWQTP